MSSTITRAVIADLGVPVPSYVLVTFEDEGNAEEFLELLKVGAYHVDWPVLREVDECDVAAFTTDGHVEIRVSSGD